MVLRNALLFLLATPLMLFSQQLPLNIQGQSPSFFLNHTVGAKENYYSIGRLYNVSPSINIAPFNNLKMEDGLKIGQSIMIPLVATNFSQDGAKATDEVLVPIYYLTNTKYSLNQISSLFNKVPASSLKKWNNLSNDQVSSNTKLIIGYLKVKKELSALAAAPSVKQQVEDKSITAPEKNIPKPEIKNSPIIKKAEPDVEVADKKTPELQNGENFSGGYFRALYEKQKNNITDDEQTGTAGIFKSTSGWEDGKYYCLNNKATAGTIVKITNNANQKSIYAKVLDVIPDMKQNDGQVIRLSNAGAAELGINSGTFECTVKF